MTEQTTRSKIFIVEDEVLVATDLALRLEKLGYKVSGKAASGENALDSIESDQPDLVVMDIALSGELDGIETADIIRNRWGIPVVLLTAYSDNARLERAKLVHPYGYILKPFQDRELQIVLEMALYVSKMDTERRLSEERYRNLFTTTNDGICLHEMVYRDGKPIDYRILDTNPKYETFTGINRKKAIGALASELYGTGKPPFLDIYYQVIDTGQPRSFETYFEPMDKYFSISAYSPGPHLFATMFQDITDRKATEAALAQSEKKYRLLAENTCDVIFMTDHRLKTIYYSPSVEQMMGYTPEEMIDLPPEAYIAAETLSPVLDRMKRRLECEASGDGDDESRTWKLKYIHKDGHGLYVELITTPIRRDDGTFEGLVGVVREVTDRVKAEKALKESEERYRHLFEASQAAISVYDIHGVCLMMNEKAAHLLGDKPARFIGKSYDRIHFFPTGEFQRRFAQVLDSGQVRTTDGWMDFPAGKRWIMSNTHPVRNSRGRITALQIIGQDITELKQAEEEKSNLEAQLRQAQKMEAVGTLAGGIAHDFNNLLQAIYGYTQIILMDKDESDSEYQNLMAIQNAGNRAAELVRQLLLFSRKVESERRPINLNRQIELTKVILERTLPKMIEIEVNPFSPLWTIDADSVQMEQILLNLGKNAADAMPDGGKLTIETENITLREEYTKSHLGAVPGNYVLMTVSDTGVGMDKKTLAHIFEPFYTTKEIGQGTGLGLASVYGVVKNHGGYIMCYSEKGQGATFKIYLPAVGADGNASELDLVLRTPQKGTETILVVDDEDYIRDFASQVLEKFGYTVLAADSGEKALEIFETGDKEIDLVLLDIGMPGMGGHRCLKELKKQDPRVRVIIASGYTVNGHAKAALDAGAMGYIGKPYQLSDLLARVREALDQSSSDKITV